MSGASAPGPAINRIAPALGIQTRGQLFAAAAFLLLANGIIARAFRTAVDEGLIQAVYTTFQISIIAWVAAGLCIALLLRNQERELRPSDVRLGVFSVIAALMPMSQFSWVAATIVAAYLILASECDEQRSLRRGGALFLAIAAAMFWGRLLLQLGGDFILELDARVVALLTGTVSKGNLVKMASGDGWVWIAPWCSSVTNMSLAMLCCVAFVSWYGLGWNRQQLRRCLAACLAVILINDLRIGWIVLRPQQYELVHGDVGSTVTSWLTLGVVLAICLIGNKVTNQRAAA